MSGRVEESFRGSDHRSVVKGKMMASKYDLGKSDQIRKWRTTGVSFLYVIEASNYGNPFIHIFHPLGSLKSCLNLDVLTTVHDTCPYQKNYGTLRFAITGCHNSFAAAGFPYTLETLYGLSSY